MPASYMTKVTYLQEGSRHSFSFAQVLTESAKLAKSCLLVISLPASDTATTTHSRADDVEVGGQRGREALERLRNGGGDVLNPPGGPQVLRKVSR
jgi:hypothetical protein